MSRRAAFVPPVIPANCKEIPLHVVFYENNILRTSRSHSQNSITALRLSKKKTVAAPPKKIQVKMLKYVEGTGHVGEVVMVTPAFFQNKLRPTASAFMISNEEVLKEKAEQAAQEQETRAKAESLKEQLTGLSISMLRKAGPDGHLFGGIGPKSITEELGKQIHDDFLKNKSVKIQSIADENGGVLRGDVKHTGTYHVFLSLTNDISASFDMIVAPET
jgi:ribosomal protein L9